MPKKKKETQNYLDFVPRHKAGLDWKQDSSGVVLLVENKGVWNRLAQKFAKKPKVSQIHLEEMGSFIWPLIDGERSVYDISLLVKEEFGEKAEPLYNRLVQYFHTLEAYDFVEMKKPNNYEVKKD